jgi:hypothetical protein
MCLQLQKHITDPEPLHYYQTFNSIKLSRAVVLEMSLLLFMDFDYGRITVVAYVAKLTPWSQALQKPPVAQLL